MAGFYDTPGMDTSGGSSSDGSVTTLPDLPDRSLGQDFLSGGSLTDSSGLPSWLTAMLPPGLGGSGGSNMQYLIPAMVQAFQSYKNADQYMGMANQYADKMDPFGSQRGFYQDQLKQAQANPAGYISSLPSYQAALQLGLGSLNRGVMAKQGAVNNADDIAYASNLASQTWNNEMNRLGGLAGANIGPGAAAALIQTGIQGAVNQRNQALGSMFMPFYGQPNQTTINNGAPGGSSGGGGPGSGIRPGTGSISFGGIGTGGLPGMNDGGSGDNGNLATGTTGGGGPDLSGVNGGGSWFVGGDGNTYQYNDTLGS